MVSDQLALGHPLGHLEGAAIEVAPLVGLIWGHAQRAGDGLPIESQRLAVKCFILHWSS